MELTQKLAAAYNNTLVEKVKQQIAQAFPIKVTRGNKTRELRLKSLRIEMPDNTDLEKFEQAKLKGKDWEAPVRATLQLVENGKVIDEKTVTLFMLPVFTPHASLMTKGTEYTIPTQLRLKPSIYTKAHPDGTFEARVNVLNGENFRIVFNPEKGTLRLVQGNKSFKLLPVLRTLGVTDKEMKAAWGDAFDYIKANDDGTVDLEELMNRARSKRYEYTWQKIEHIQDPKKRFQAYMNELEIDDEVTSLTIGHKSKKVDGATLLKAVQKLLEIAQGKDEPSGTTSLLYKKAIGPIQHLQEKINLALQLLDATATDRIMRFDEIERILPPNYIGKPIEQFVKQSSISQALPNYSPVTILTNLRKVTITGEGGIEDPHAITAQDRMLDPFSAAFLDPVLTPESDKIGANVYTTLGTLPVLDEPELKSVFYDVKNKKYVQLRPLDAYKRTIAFPKEGEIQDDGTVKWKSSRVKVLKGGKVTTASPQEVDLLIPKPEFMFAPSTILSPFLDSLQPNRALMAGKHLTQAIPLAEPEEPLVQVKASDADETLEKKLGEGLALRSPVDGKVVSVTDRSIKIQDKNGKIHEVKLYKNYVTGEHAVLYHRPRVKKGDTVKKGDVIADLNTTKNGKLAMGVNLRVAYMPYKGYNFEDGIVVSESAAKKLASEHAYTYEIDTDNVELVSPDRYRALFPGKFAMEDFKHIGSDGLPKKGATIEPGKPIYLAIAKRGLGLHEAIVGDKFAQVLSQWRDLAETWEGSVAATVSEVVKAGKKVRIVLRTVEPLKTGDKIVARHGNKGTVGLIVPDEEMPKDEQGRPIEVIMNPHGVPSRINPSQILEAALGKVAEKIGKPIAVESFSDVKNHKYVQELLKKHGLKDKEKLTDPTGEPIEGEVFTGVEYFVKLPQRVETKTTIRQEWGYDADLQPLRGSKEEGGSRAIDPLLFYSLVSHDARETLKEMATYKSEKNDDFWLSLEMGRVPPPPKPTFAFDKMLAYLKASGINVAKKGDELIIKPMTDKDIEELKPVEIKDATMLNAKNFNPERGGLFSPELGGLFGKKWGVITLPVPMLNPAYEDIVAFLLGLSKQEVKDLASGKKGITESGQIVPADKAKYIGGEALEKLLEKVDPDKLIQQVETELEKTKNPKEIGRLARRLRIAEALKRKEINPTDFIMRRVPVLPTMFRPIFRAEENLLLVSPVNYAYRNLLITKNSLLDVKHTMDEKEFKKRATQMLYRRLNELVNAVPKGQSSQEAVGTLTYLAGKGSPKTGFIHSKVFKKRQELSSTGVLQNGPDLDLDEVAIPEDMAWELYKPFIIKELKMQGYSLSEARKMVEERHELAKIALEKELKRRPVLVNRPPSLHEYNIQAFFPKIYKPKEGEKERVVRMNPMVLKGFNADMDGDSIINTILIRVEVREGNEKEGLTSIPPSWYDVDGLVKEAQNHEGGDSMVSGKTKVRYAYGLVDMEEFPRGKLIEVRGNKEIYEVPEGVEVLTIDKDGNPIWKKPKLFHIHKNLDLLEVKTHRGHVLHVSPDKSLVTLDEELNFIHTEPKEGIMVPRMLSEELVRDIQPTRIIPLKNVDDNFRTNKLELDYDLGYFFGAMVGDGWSDWPYRTQIHLSKGEPALTKRVHEIIHKYLKRPVKDSVRVEMHDFGGGKYKSTKHTWSSPTLARLVKNLIGSKAAEKHLPYWWLHAPEEFRWGLLAGLIDTDGTVAINYVKSKKTPNIQVAYTTISRKLAYEISALAHSLGLVATVAITKQTSSGQFEFTITFSQPSLKKMAQKLNLAHPKKAEKLQKAASLIKEENALQKVYAAPLSKERLTELRKMIGAPRGNDPDAKFRRSLYIIVDKVLKGKAPGISKDAYYKIKEVIGEKLAADEFWRKWMELSEKYDWERVVEVKKIAENVDMYDLTIEDPYVFTTETGIVVADTVGVFVPATEKARQEAIELMLPSKNLFRPGNAKVMPDLRMEYISGLYKMMKMSLQKQKKMPAKTYGSWLQLFKDWKDNKIDAYTPVTLDGVTAPAGIHLVVSALPRNMRDYKKPLTKKEINNILDTLARTDPNTFHDVIDAWKNVGRYAMYRFPVTVGVEDLEDTELKNYIDKKLQHVESLKSEQARIENLEKLSKELEDLLKERAKLLEDKNGFYLMLNTGARGNPTQVRQIVAAPVAVADTYGRTLPVPIRRSYSEGVTPAEYFAASFGARAGMVSKKMGIAEPGALTKEFLASTSDLVVTKQDTEDPGVPVEPDDALNRISAETIPGVVKEGELITPKIVQKLKAQGIKRIHIKSMLSAPTKFGVPATSVGLNETGKLPHEGENIGVKLVQAITEPLSQATFNLFHTGSAKKSGESVGNILEAVRFYTHMPESGRIRSATLAQVAGRVSKIEKNPAGGHFIYIEGKRHYVPAQFSIKVKEGDWVRKGQPLSGGPVHPLEVMELRGENEARLHLAKNLKDILNKFGIKASLQTVEPLTRSLTSTAVIVDPGPARQYLSRGDYVPQQFVDMLNRKLGDMGKRDPEKALGMRVKKTYGTVLHGTKIDKSIAEELKRQGYDLVEVYKDVIKYKMVMPGSLTQPLYKENWLHKLTTGRIKSTLIYGSAAAERAKIKGTTSPGAAWMHGATFGEKKPYY